MFRTITFLLCFWPIAAIASPPPTVWQTEVNYLLQHLDQSGCKFFRNGSWYSANEAHNHLKKKFDYLAGKGQIQKTEDFIEKAASQSSMSHQLYQVSCNGGTPVPSGQWLADALMRYRKQLSGDR